MPDYIKWLRRLHVELSVEVMEHDQKGLIIPEYLINGLRLIENEAENIKKQTGKSFLGKEKISERFKEKFD